MDRWPTAPGATRGGPALLRDRRRHRRRRCSRRRSPAAWTWSSCATAALGDDELLAAAARFRAACDEHDALFWLNDRPDLALRAGADGVHVGQDDTPVAEVRADVGPDLLIGLSTHSPDQLEAAIAAGADQLSVGPVWETPTKPGRPATGLDYVRHAAERRPPQPWFAIGGIDTGERRRGGRRPAPSGSSSCARCATRPTRAPRPASCLRRLGEEAVGAAQ